MSLLDSTMRARDDLGIIREETEPLVGMNYQLIAIVTLKIVRKFIKNAKVNKKTNWKPRTEAVTRIKPYFTRWPEMNRTDKNGMIKLQIFFIYLINSNRSERVISCQNGQKHCDNLAKLTWKTEKIYFFQWVSFRKS